MSKRLDVIGQVHGRLTIVGDAASDAYGHRNVRCQCVCGTDTVVNLQNVRRGLTTSCGCYHREWTGKMSRRHGRRQTREYEAWWHMRQRCEDPNHISYQNYGGRGIRVCDRWKDFTLFFADMGPRPSAQHSLDRFPDQNGNYKPGNCRWATRRQQMRNKRINVRITIGGMTKTLVEWLETQALSVHTYHSRLRRGWSIQRALTEEVPHRSTTR